MNYMKTQIKRVSQNRTILFTILGAYFFTIILLSAGSVRSDTIKTSVVALCSIVVAVFLLSATGSFASIMNYKKSKAFKRLGRFGSESAEAVNMVVSHEVEKAALFVSKKLTLTGHWVCFQGVFSVQVYPVSQLIWTYTQIIKYPTGTYHRVVLSLSDGKQLYAKLKDKKKCGEMLLIVSREYPHVLTGYGKDLLRLYRNDMEGFIRSAADIKGIGR